MKRVVPFVAMITLVSVGAWAQTPPPPTPPPPPPPPMIPAVPPVVATPVAPVPMPAPAPTVLWRGDRPFTFTPMTVQAPMPPMTIDAYPTWTHSWADQAVPIGFRGNGSDTYSQAIGLFERRQYEQAISSFDRVIAQKGAKTDAAMHWKAFSQFRLGRWEDSLATIAQLRRDHPQSRYLGDAKVLEADVRRFSGQSINPAQIDDDELKLIALSGLQRTDPERAIPLVEQVLHANNSLRVKKQALFVLAQSGQARAHEILLGYAKGQGNPDLQSTAISYVASRRGQTTGRDLTAIYQSTTDPAIRMAIINAYRTAGNRESLIHVAGDHAVSVDLRSRAVNNLNGLISPQDLWSLYEKESNRDLRLQMISVFSSMRAFDQLSQIARTEKDPVLRQRAIRALGGQPVEQTSKLLVDMYDAGSDLETRRAIISALGTQNNAEGLIAIARKEPTLSVKGEIVTKIAAMAPKSKAAADYLAEIVR